MYDPVGLSPSEIIAASGVIALTVWVVVGLFTCIVAHILTREERVHPATRPVMVPEAPAAAEMSRSTAEPGTAFAH